jgi:ketosteroid isomerase-like protein
MSNTTTVKHLLKLFETFDVDGFLGYLTEDAVYRFGNYPAAVGKDAIAATIKASHMDQITGIAFDIKDVYEKDDAVISELVINYSLVNGKTISLPCVDVFRFEGEKVKAMLVFMDASPLFAP